jgi:hypothetical protein
MEFYSATKQNEFCHSQVNGWNHFLSEVSQDQRPKIACSPSYVDSRPKTNAVMILDMDHTLREEHAQEE